jgi:hypothetical protein
VKAQLASEEPVADSKSFFDGHADAEEHIAFGVSVQVLR